MQKFSFNIFLLIISFSGFSQNETEVIKQVKDKLDKVSDYQASGIMKMDISFINAPDSKVAVYYKKPNKFKVKKDGGISILPKGGVSINMNTLVNEEKITIVPSGNEKIGNTETSIFKLLPDDENSDVVLTKLWVDVSQSIIRKAVVTTKESGTYEIMMDYGKFTEWGLPDKVTFIFNTKEYKMPKGVTFEYEKGGEKKAEKLKNKKGKVEITYSNYIINKGVSDSIFQ